MIEIINAILEAIILGGLLGGTVGGTLSYILSKKINFPRKEHLGWQKLFKFLFIVFGIFGGSVLGANIYWALLKFG